MNPRIRSLAFAALATLFVAALASSPAAAQTPTPGERWRTKMSMEAMGMTMPGRSEEVCTPIGSTDAPMGANEDCTSSNVRHSGNTQTFDMSCKDGTTGTMEMTRESPTKWRGKMTANTEDGPMMMRMESEKLPGECDANATRRKMNEIVARGEAQQRKMCLESAKENSALQFVGTPASCTDPDSRKVFCDNARSMRGFNAVSSQQRMGASYRGPERNQYTGMLAKTGKLCGFDAETVRSQHCGTAQGKKEWKFLAEECPAVAQPLAQRECAGRDFTTPVAPPFVDFCSAYAAAGRTASGGTPPSAGAESAPDDASGKGGNSTAGGAQSGANGQSGGEQPATTTDKAKDAMNKGKQALKGLFGR